MIIVTRHKAVVQWLAMQGIYGEVIEHITNIEQIKDQDVIGSIPYHFAAYAKSVTSVEIPNLPAERRNKELNVDEMIEFGAYLQKYIVRKD